MTPSTFRTLCSSLLTFEFVHLFVDKTQQFSKAYDELLCQLTRPKSTWTWLLELLCCRLWNENTTCPNWKLALHLRLAQSDPGRWNKYIYHHRKYKIETKIQRNTTCPNWKLGLHLRLAWPDPRRWNIYHHHKYKYNLSKLKLGLYLRLALSDPRRWNIYISPTTNTNIYKNTKKYNLSKLKARSDLRLWNINTSSQLLQNDIAAAQTLQTFVNPGHFYLHHFFILFFLLLLFLQHQLHLHLFWYHSAVCHSFHYPNWQTEAREGGV